MDNARNIWREMYRGEPFDTDLRADWSQRPLPRYTTRISYDIVYAVNKQEDFYYQVQSLPLFSPVCVCVCVCVCVSVCLSVCLCVSVCLYEVNKQKDFYYSRRGWFLPLRFLSFCPSHPLYISIFPFLLFKKERICFFFCIDVSAGFLRQCPNSTLLLELFSRNM